MRTRGHNSAKEGRRGADETRGVPVEPAPRPHKLVSWISEHRTGGRVQDGSLTTPSSFFHSAFQQCLFITFRTLSVNPSRLWCFKFFLCLGVLISILSCKRRSDFTSRRQPHKFESGFSRVEHLSTRNISISTHQAIIRMVKKISEESVDSGECYYCQFCILAIVFVSRQILYYEIKPLSNSLDTSRLFVLLRSEACCRRTMCAFYGCIH